MKIFEKTLSTEKIYDGKIIRLSKDAVELPNGNLSFREVIEHSGGVCVLPLTADGEVIMVEQFRYPFKSGLLEIPAGKLEHGENPLDCGKRELHEETGYRAKRFDFLGEVYPTPAYDTEVIYMYLARELFVEIEASVVDGNRHLDEDEFLNVVKMPFDKVVEMVMRNELPDAKTQIAVLKAERMLRL